MKKLPLLAGLLFFAATCLSAAEPQIPEDEKIWAYLMQRRQEMIRVTRKPYRVNWAGAVLCARPNSIPHSPHGGHWIHVFVSPGGTNAMVTGKGAYPQGTIILKQKFLDAAGTNTEFFTGMRKREWGYNPGSGDWEFFTLDSRGQTVTARGKIESCMDCHAKYEATDFVSRRYLTMKEDEERRAIWPGLASCLCAEEINGAAPRRRRYIETTRAFRYGLPVSAKKADVGFPPAISRGLIW